MKFFYIKQYNKAIYVRGVKGLEDRWITKDLGLYFHTQTNDEIDPVKHTYNTIGDYYDALQKQVDTKKPERTIYASNSIDNAYTFAHYTHNNVTLSDLNVLFFDIETAYSLDLGYGTTVDPHQPILTITATLGKGAPMHVFEWKGIPAHSKPEAVQYVSVNSSSEEEMLERFVSWAQDSGVHILTGWNIAYYDVPYIINRLKRLNRLDLVAKLSPLQDAKYITEVRDKDDPDLVSYKIDGISILDYSLLYKKFTYSSETYIKLNTVAKAELNNQSKVEYTGVAYNLQNLYEKDYALFIEYNIKDVELIVQLEEKLRFLELAVSIQTECLATDFENIFTTLSNSISLNNQYYIKFTGHFPEYVDPLAKKMLLNANTEYGAILGGYVLPPKKGVYKNVVCLDFKSLYPSIIRTFNIGTDTLVTGGGEMKRPKGTPAARDRYFKNLHEQIQTQHLDFFDAPSELTITGNLQMYSKTEQSILSKIMEHLFEQRISYQKEMKTTTDPARKNILKLKQQAFKILLNSQFGALANKYYIYGSYGVAESITATGQYLLKYIVKQLEKMSKTMKEFGGPVHVIYGDTDSIFLSMPNTPLEDIERLVKEYLIPRIDFMVHDACFNQLIAYKNHLEISLEDVFERGIFWDTKKRYYLRRADRSVKKAGISSVRSDFSPLLSKTFEHCIELVLEEREHEIDNLLETIKQDPSCYLSLGLRVHLRDNVKKFRSNVCENVRNAHTYKKAFVEGLLTGEPPISLELLSEKEAHEVRDYLTTKLREGKPLKYKETIAELLWLPHSKGTPAHYQGAMLWNRLVEEKGLKNKYDLIEGAINIAKIPLKPQYKLGNWLSVPIDIVKEIPTDLIDLEKIDLEALIQNNLMDKIREEILIEQPAKEEPKKSKKELVVAG